MVRGGALKLRSERLAGAVRGADAIFTRRRESARERRTGTGERGGERERQSTKSPYFPSLPLSPSHSSSLLLTLPLTPPYHSPSLSLTPPVSPSLSLIPPHSPSLLITPPVSPSLLITLPHSSSLLITPPHSSCPSLRTYKQSHKLGTK
uniref:Uncharacterized protein n=1 Tax=Knipowitschia caucasica TaxID=637954 RepID=A0AAV2LH23_KNICA